MTDKAVFGLQKYLHNCLEFDRRYQIIDLKDAQEIGNRTLSILKDFGYLGVRISLMNAGPQIKQMLLSEGRGDIAGKIYDVTDSELAVLLFKKELLLSDH